MTTAIDSAISPLQVHALAISGVKAAPNYPVQDAAALPLSIAYITEGSGTPNEATFTKELYTIAVEFHVSLVSLKQAYTQLDAIIPAFLRKRAGDPTLNGAVATIVFPVSFTVVAGQFDQVPTVAARFLAQVKVLGTPTT